MPYILQDKRDRLDPLINALHAELVSLESDDESNNMEGNLNYTVTRLLRMVYGQSYSEFNDAIGVLECIKLEHYTTQAAPYEAQKKFENGDVDSNAKPVTLRAISVETEDSDRTKGHALKPQLAPPDIWGVGEEPYAAEQYDLESGTKEQLLDPKDKHLR